jgi:hypothetical protein
MLRHAGLAGTVTKDTHVGRSRSWVGTAVSPLALLVAALVAIAIGVGFAVSQAPSHRAPVTRAPAAGGARQPLSSLPSALQGPVSAAIGAGNSAYAVRATPAGLRLANPAQHFAGSFAASGVSIASGHATLGLRLVSIGYGGALHGVATPAPSAHANRVVYRHKGVTESYANGPLGLEQTFTIPRPLAGRPHGSLTLSMALSGGARPTLSGDGKSVTFSAAGSSLRYGGLTATDARGRILPATIGLAGGRLRLEVDTRGASYPVHVDPFMQQGVKLVPVKEEVGKGVVGLSVAISGDGDTAVVGAPTDNSNIGAAFVFTRTGETWTQQGTKLTASGESGAAFFGWSVKLSSNGDIAAISGTNDNGNKGAVWIFSRSGETWSQSGSKLTGTEENGTGFLGESIALTPDGTTLVAGGPDDNNRVGAAWVFTRSGETWTQQGPKLKGTGEMGQGYFGYSVAVSSDGNTALLGAPGDSNFVGAAFVFTRSGETWSQQGGKLTGSGESGTGYVAQWVALSADGNTAALGAPGDNNFTGATWIFTRSEETWSQQGSKLTGTGEVGQGKLGWSVALSSNGNVLFAGGPNDNGNRGAAWTFERSGETWSQVGSKLTVADQAAPALFGEAVALSPDGETAIVGGPFNASEIGAAWVFKRSGEGWAPQGPPLSAAGELGPGQLGWGVSLSADGNTAAIGGPYHNGNLGAVWIFQRNGSGAWSESKRLVAAGEVETAGFGFAVAMSADGHVIAVGGPGDTANKGGAWVFTHSGGAWSQQKLSATGESGAGLFGLSVAVSADAGTVMVGASADSSTTGAVWVYTRSGEAWTQQGPKLTATGEIGAGEFGNSVNLSSDGNTALITAGLDNGGIGAAFVFTRSGETWSQQGGKLTGNGEVGNGYFGFFSSLSADGSTALIGAPLDNSKHGAAFVFTRSGESWSQQGSKLTGVGELGAAEFGFSVGLSEDGNTAIVGGPLDASSVGAAWIFTRSVEAWSQLGPKLTGAEEVGAGEFGLSVALSADGKTAVVGGNADNGNTGALWAFAPAPTVESVTPNSGPTQGGTEVTITGTKFTGATAVHFGAASAASFTVNNDGSITAMTPAGVGTVDVTVTQQNVTSQAAPADHFTYLPPAVESVAPNAGPLAGGTEVTVTGLRFTGATAVHFGAASAASFKVESETLLTAVAPPGSSGAVDVTVSVANATSPTGSQDQFTYVALPAVAKISVKKGPAGGGTEVIVTGSKFTGATSVNFGSVAATPTVKGDGEISVLSPPHASETASVTVTTPGGMSSVNPKAAFKYGKPTVTNVNAGHGSKAGGSVVTVTGTGFAPGSEHTTFSFGKTLGTAVSCVSSTSCTVTTPSATKTGPVDVVAAVGKNKSKKSRPADEYTYE